MLSTVHERGDRGQGYVQCPSQQASARRSAKMPGWSTFTCREELPIAVHERRPRAAPAEVQAVDTIL